MRTFLLILLVLAMAGAVFALVRGVVLMASGRDPSGEQQQQWMRKRVLYQGIAIALIALILMLASASS